MAERSGDGLTFGTYGLYEIYGIPVRDADGEIVAVVDSPERAAALCGQNEARAEGAADTIGIYRIDTTGRPVT